MNPGHLPAKRGYHHSGASMCLACTTFWTELRCIYLPRWGSSSPEQWTYQCVFLVLLLFVTFCLKYAVLSHVAHDLLYLFYLNDLGLSIFIIIYDTLFQPIWCSYFSSVGIIYLTNMCSWVLETVYGDEAILVSILFLSIFAWFCIWKWIRNLSTNVNICAYCSYASPGLIVFHLDMTLFNLWLQNTVIFEKDLQL